MHCFLTYNYVWLSSSSSSCANILSPYSKETYLRYVSKVEANTSSIGATIFTDLVPNDIGFVSKTPPSHNF